MTAELVRYAGAEPRRTRSPSRSLPESRWTKDVGNSEADWAGTIPASRVAPVPEEASATGLARPSTRLAAVGVPVVASGGVGTLDHLVEGVTRGHASAVLAASIFHFGTHSIAEAHAALRGAGLPARG